MSLLGGSIFSRPRERHVLRYLLSHFFVALLGLGLGFGCAAVKPMAPAPQALEQNERLVEGATGMFSAVVPDHGWQIVERLPSVVALEPGDRPPARWC